VALGSANHRRTSVYRAARAFYEMDWDIFFNPGDRDDPRRKPRVIQFYNYEILVPHCVPVEYILADEA
jgi:hypothetical protein